uniref:F-box domain-containing protein n=1 Tax=Oryza nivara TaxID=4536 RepID=A0A0E0HSD2_ORYNI
MADRKKCKAAAVATTDGGGEDHISALPDEVLQRALSFLPSRDVVRTCVLSRRWRHQWKSVPALRIYAFDDCRDVQHLSDFVTNFLLRRNRLALHECDITCFDEGDGCEVFRENARQWIRVELGAFSLDFSSCRGGCIIKDKVKQILSESLRRLRIEGCDFFRNRTRISCPNLISLEITDFTLYTPVLMSMPSLASAFIRFGEHCADSCDCYYYGEFGPDYTGCHHSTVKGNGTVLLNGLSDAIQLELISGAGVFIFRRDFRCCPTFNKLKTLLLNEWCMAADSSALIYFLQHSPVLEKLTLQLRKSPRTMVKRGSTNKNQNEKFLVSKHLKLVEIKYCEDEMVQQVLHVLSFSFEQRK